MKTLSKITFCLLMFFTSFSLQAQTNFGLGSGTGGTNYTFVGNNAGRISIGTNNSFFGKNTGYNNTTGDDNTFLGSYAGYANTTGTNNVFIGRTAGRFNTIGSENSFVGSFAGYKNTTGTRNTFTGYASGRFNTTGHNNSFTGYYAGYANTAGKNNTFTGYASGRFNTTGVNNTFTGYYSGYANTVGQNNTFTGYTAGRFNTTGNNNTFTGVGAGFENTTGYSNAFTGRDAGRKNTTGYKNSFFGTNAGRENTTGSGSTYIGDSAGRFTTAGDNNVFIGYASGYKNTTGGNSTFTGVAAGYENTTGNYNTFNGRDAGRKNTTGTGNTFLGYQTGYDVETADYNTMLGYRAGFNATGGSNVFLGYQAGYNEPGNDKLYISNSATSNPLIKGDFSDSTLVFNGKVGVNGIIPTGSNIPSDIKLYVQGRFAQEFEGNIGSFGPNDKWSSLGISFAPPGLGIPDIYGMISQGYGAALISGSKDDGNNVISFSGNRLDFDVIGTGGSFPTRMSVLNNGRVGIGFTNPQYELDINGSIRVIGSYFGSDKRYKENIKDIENAMDKIIALDGVTYDFKAGEINGYNFKAITDKKQIGFIAQDVKKVLPELVDADENDYLSINYVAIIPVLVEGMKEQQDVIDEQEILIDEQQQEITEQQEQITDLQSRMERLEALLTDNENIQGSNLPSNQDINIAGVMLRQNAPNPFSNSTTIQYELPENLGVASLVVYDFNSRPIATYSITGKGSIEFNANGLPNGTYGYTILVNGKSVASQKMIIQK